MYKILVADDDIAILDAVKAVLEEATYEVITASSSVSLQRKIQKDSPDLVLMDILMSGSDGREIVYFLRHEKMQKDLPIIMISALPNAEKTAKDAGANAFLAKPFDIQDLLELIKKHLPQK